MSSFASSASSGAVHSFPTRRSSDLRFEAAGEDARGSPRSRGRDASSSAAYRSEEHTSELQSHSDLVCRLLLEKKNPLYRAPAETAPRFGNRGRIGWFVGKRAVEN